MIPHGPGLLADPTAPPERWGGRKAQAYVKLTLEHYGTVCYLCGLPGATSADHVIARVKGGAVYDLRNLGPAHKKCNEARRDRDAAPVDVVIENGMDYFMQ